MDAVMLPREIVEVLVKAWPVCRVCTGESPASDGHDANPPCIGYARRVAVEVLSAK